MREIKFRAKANIDNEWIYASNIHKVVLDDTNEELWVMHPKGEKIEHLGDGYIKYRPLVVDEETIGQYSGLKDKNGVEIYEGGVVLCRSGEVYQGISEYETTLVVEFGFIQEMWGLPECDAVEVIGNIHENPELLKESENE